MHISKDIVMSTVFERNNHTTTSMCLQTSSFCIRSTARQNPSSILTTDFSFDSPLMESSSSSTDLLFILRGPLFHFLFPPIALRLRAGAACGSSTGSSVGLLSWIHCSSSGHVAVTSSNTWSKVALSLVMLPLTSPWQNRASSSPRGGFRSMLTELSSVLDDLFLLPPGWIKKGVLFFVRLIF